MFSRFLLSAAAFLFLVSTVAIPTGRAETVIETGKKVKFNYTLSVDGEVVDSSEQAGPFEYTHGNNEIPPGLEVELMGLKAGEKKNIVVPPEVGFGPVDENAIVEVPRSRLPEGEVQVGAVLETQTASGDVLQAELVELKDDKAVLNFNHPLAGKTLTFDVEITEIS